MLSPRDWDLSSPNLAPKAWRVGREPGNAGSDVSGGSSNNRVVHGAASGEAGGTGEGLPAARRPVPCAVPSLPEQGFQKVPPTLGRVFPHPGAAPYSCDSDVWPVDFKADQHGFCEICGTVRKPATASSKPRETVENLEQAFKFSMTEKLGQWLNLSGGSKVVLGAGAVAQVFNPSTL